MPNPSPTTLATPLAVDFTAAIDATLAALQHLLPMDQWMLTRVEGDAWIVLHTRGQSPRIRPGSAFSWEHSYCTRMHAGDGPNIAPDARAVAAYADAKINEQLRIGCYVGFPVLNQTGRLHGTLCGLHPEPMDPAIERHQPVIQALAEALGHVLSLDLRAQTLDRLRQRTALAAHSDPLTGTLNRDGWNLALEAEETRCQLHGHPAGVIVLDLFASDPKAGALAIEDDTELVRAVLMLQGLLHPTDLLARLEGRRFALLATAMDDEALPDRAQRLADALSTEGIPVLLGYALREPGAGSLARAYRRAVNGLRPTARPADA
ncbi:GGDEF domain-containing protein [Thioalkalivibrio sp. ALJ16]|uniref:GGDEF domain-containing protein n=1 Tax=Thioalkalivibrio sp. ALJ16 TaxID=1158762 RepID=UPI000381F87D|nr:diguanylate cyclase [Thioalkalivibrio sp. ALJ16]